MTQRIMPEDAARLSLSSVLVGCAESQPGVCLPMAGEPLDANGIMSPGIQPSMSDMVDMYRLLSIPQTNQSS